MGQALIRGSSALDDNAAEKSFEPTSSRLAKAREDGNIARSVDLATNASFVGATLAVVAVLPSIAQMLSFALRRASDGSISLRSIGMALLLSCAPLLGAGTLAVCAGLAQSKGLLITALKVDVSRLNPVNGFQRMFSRETLTQLARAGSAFLLAAVVVGIGLRNLMSVALHLAPLSSIAQAVYSTIRLTIGSLVLLGLLFAAVDYGVAHKHWMKKLRMSFADIKRESREHDGDPHQRGRRRSLARALLKGSVRSVSDAAFVIVNPTHVAVALAYAPPTTPVPRVLVRAIDEAALRVRVLAEELAIPIIEHRALARALYAQTNVGAEVPSMHFLALAQIVAELSAQGLLR